MRNSSALNNELRGTIANIINPIDENILIYACIYIAIKGLNIIFLYLHSIIL